MIVKVTKRITENESTFTVEYDNGKCRRFYEITDPIIKFISNKAPLTTTCNNGKVKYYTWE